MAAAEPLIAVRDVGKSFAVRGGALTVFERISFDIPRGQFLTIIGASGCGKSTLLQVIAGLARPSSGAVTFKRQVVTAPPPGMIYVFQQYAKSVFPWRTVDQNMRFGLERLKLSRKDMGERVSRTLSLIGLQGYEQYYPSQLSGGMQQRLALGRALVCEPEVILMDEPFSAVDALTRMLLQQQLLEIWEQLRTTIVFVTHDVEEAVLLSQRVICMGGRPAVIQEDVGVDLRYPRSTVTTKEEPEFLRLRHHLLDRVMHGPAGSTAPPPAPVAESAPAVLPAATGSQR